MSRTKKDRPWRVTHPDGVVNWYQWNSEPKAGDSGFRKTRRWLKRVRNKHIRRYSPESRDNGARPPYNGMKRTWDFE